MMGMLKRRPAVLASAFAAILGLLLAGCDDTPTAQATPAPPPVTVAQPVQKSIIEWDEYTGRFSAVESVNVRARVSGYLSSVHFREGEIVKKGDLLIVIDPRPFEIALGQAQAELLEAKAQLDLETRELERARPLLQRKTMSREVFDERLQSQIAAQAALQVAESRVQAAQLNLEYTEIRAPVTGRISNRMVTVGNLISGGSADATLLTTIVSLDPIHFYFDADERAYLKYVRLSKSGQRPSSRDTHNPVYLALADETEFAHRGHMDFVDNQVDFGTGTIRGRAIFQNSDLLFVPGLFARMRLQGSGEYQATLLPDRVIGTDQSRKFVYVVDKEGTVAARPVTLGPIIDGLRVIRTGLQPDDWVIINGIQRARTGGKVAAERSTIDTVAAAKRAQ
ncbi:MAG: efflux RND transporter periplasmic adaptor subunit [Alphaproteobacteria bacterium]|nr:efflux RND transporter periplasmic adaptor subunit [Alphaproteobacteria bacterium]